MPLQVGLPAWHSAWVSVRRLPLRIDAVRQCIKYRMHTDAADHCQLRALVTAHSYLQQYVHLVKCSHGLLML